MKKLLKIILTFINCLFCFSLFQVQDIVIVGLAILIFLNLKFLYPKIEKKLENFNGKEKRNIIIFSSFIFTFIPFIISFLKSKIGFYDFTLNVFLVLYIASIIYFYCKRNGSAKTALVSVIMSEIVCTYIFVNCKLNIRIFALPISITMLYIMEGFDYKSLLRKKNIVRILMLFFLALASIFISPICLITLIPIFIEGYKKIPDKNSSFFGFLMIVIPLLLLLTKYRNYIYIQDVFITQQMINILLLLTIIYSFVVILVKKDSTLNKKIMLILSLEYIVLIFDKNLILVWNTIPLLILFLSVNLDKDLSPHFSIKKYFVPKKENIKKVSVVIPNYNYANYIEERIDSVLKQNYPIYELIVLDDASKDDSLKIIEKKLMDVKQNYPKLNIKFILNKKNSGNVFKQWQKAFEVSTGDYLWIAEADDLCSKYFLNAVMKGFKKDVVMSYTESLAIDENGSITKKDLRDWIDIRKTNHWNKKYIIDGKKEIMNYTCFNNTIANVSSVVFKKDKNINFQKYLHQSQEFKLSGDWHFYSKVLMLGKINYFDESLNYHRIHKKSVTSSTDNFVQYKEAVRIQKEMLKELDFTKDQIALLENRKKEIQQNLFISNDEIYYDNFSLEQLVKEKKIKDKILLSIIIPVYNVEKYIDKCLKSIFKDLPEKTEVIVINDGSPDNSEKIVKKYEKKYPQIKYFKKKNGGLSSVKNFGLEKAQGKYVIFLDSDDYVSNNMYQVMLKKAIDKEADMVYSDVMMVFEDGTFQYWNMKNKYETNKLVQVMDNPLMAASWNKLVRKELYKDLTFPEKINNEDVAVSPILFLRSKKTCYIESPFYKYVQRSGSIQNSGFNEKRFMIFDTSKICFERIKDANKKTQEIIIGLIVTHQIIAILLYLIPKLEYESQKKYIALFCQKYKELNISNDNFYIKKYLKEHKAEHLIENVEKENIGIIYRIVKRFSKRV